MDVVTLGNRHMGMYLETDACNLKTEVNIGQQFLVLCRIVMGGENSTESYIDTYRYIDTYTL